MEQLKEYVIDTKSNDKYIIVYQNNKEFFKVSKSCNEVEDVIRLIGKLYVKEVIWYGKRVYLWTSVKSSTSRSW